jgi:RNA-directed DNA polymerase
MERWRPQHFRQIGEERRVAPGILTNALATAAQTVAIDPRLPPIFTLRHLAYLTDSDYGFLRAIAARELDDPYTVFRIRKKGRFGPRNEFRIICVPSPALMRVQRWIAEEILSRGRPHSASFAYAQGNRIVSAAELHCGCRWLIKLDVRRFFESISEIAAHRVFRSFGYQPLVAFELARLCTRVRMTESRERLDRWRRLGVGHYAIPRYSKRYIGHLPQGAPTSPMLSNLAVRTFDENVSGLAESQALVYTRYADDLCLSTRRRDFTRDQAVRVVREVYRAMGRVGLAPNISKTQIVPPGARKVVLGLVVNDSKPRLMQEFRDRLRQHLYYLERADVGPVEHAERRGFASVQGLRNHVTGLLAFARQIDPAFAEGCEAKLTRIRWPL